MSGELCIGIDVGSVSVNTFVTDPNGVLWDEGYHRTNGLPFHTALTALEEIGGRFSAQRVLYVATTGSGGRELSDLIGGLFVNEIVAQSRAVAQEIPHVRTVIEMGGEDSKLLFFKKEGGRCVLEDFSMNALCAAGTGSFLDQQAVRLGVSIEKEFGELALQCKTPPRIAGRCSVFAKTDMIHLQQVGTPVVDIVAGLCHALARNFKASIGKGKALVRPIAFQGGVAANIGMVRAFEDVLGLKPGELIKPRHFASMGALGALLIARESGEGRNFHGLDPLKAHIAKPYTSKGNLTRLADSLTQKGTPVSIVHFPQNTRTHPIDAYLGVDVGSISTNIVVIDKEHRVLAKRYLATASRPIAAIARGLDEIYGEIGDRIIIRAAGTTGSGRYLSGDIIGADVVCNEITAQAIAAIDIDPGVDTVFEIGGQDSKYISIDNGAIVDFEMNKVCAAGTGSFLEEQAKRLEIDLKSEFAPLALNAHHPVQLGDRCTVFMETDLVHHQQAGADKADLLAGLAYSTVYNYLNRVVGDKRIGRRIFFQGGTAFNKSVVSAFNKILGREVIVPPHHEVTGAIGVAINAQRRRGNRPSLFKGFDLSKRKYKLTTFECKGCENHCEIHCIKVAGEKPLFYGSRCGKYDVDRVNKKPSRLPDLFAERETLLFAVLNGEMRNIGTPANRDAEKQSASPNPQFPIPDAQHPSTSPTRPPTKGRVGIPLASIFYDQLPFWGAFFKSLGFEVEISGRTHKGTINRGIEAAVSETCFPIKVAYGHILALMDKKPDFIFLPCIVDAPMPDFTSRDKSCFNCPYIQTLPYTADAALNFAKCGTPVFSPSLFMQSGVEYMKRELGRYTEILKSDRRSINRAIDTAYRAQAAFNKALIRRGREILENLKPRQMAIVIVGRPYNTCDSGVDMGLPEKLLGMDILPIPMDMLPIDEVPLDASWRNIYWLYGLRILKAARIIRERQCLYPLYVTNFGCGPDSFLLKFFSRELGGKPFLQIEIDEHSADAGIITRCEAYLDTIASYNGATPRIPREGPIMTLASLIKSSSSSTSSSTESYPASIGRLISPGAPSVGKQNRDTTLYITQMCKHTYVLEAIFNRAGIPARVMEPSDEESLYWGRKYTTGKECYPALLTTGDIVRETHRPDFDPEHAAFFMPGANGPCRFGQYAKLHRHILDDLGLSSVSIVTLDQDRGFHRDIKGLNLSSAKAAWKGIAAVDTLERYLLTTRPYEKNPGETEVVHNEALRDLYKTILEGGSISAEAEKQYRLFSQIPTEGRGTRPLIGIVGEIYIRSNSFSNEDLIKTLEAMGAEVAMPPITEWLNYVTLVRRWRNLQHRDYWNAVKDFLIEEYMHRVERRITRTFNFQPEALPVELLELATPYLHPNFSGEAILSIGKTLELIKERGVAGVINVMPFTCMPGTIVAALLKRVREDFGGFPCISLAFTGQQSLNLRMRLEAFMYQVSERQRRTIGVFHK